MGTSPNEAVRAFGKYALVEKLGEGYLGPVYRGFDQDLGQAVVVRILCDGIRWDAAVEQQFFAECRKVAGLQHQNIAAIFDVGKEGQAFYIVMESLGVSSVKDLIVQKAAISVESKLSIMIQVAEGLGHAHKNGSLHRDLGPSKIHLTTDGCVKIRDFGIAHILKNRLPHPAIRFGIPIYISPEQIQNKNCDARSDIFAAGTIFYELLTYLHPFYDPNSNVALDNVLSDKPIPTFEKFPEAPPGIWPILKTCLARDPNDRYPNMDELANACRDLQRSLSDDTRLMLAELYASMNSLKKAAAQPNASRETVQLWQEIQSLSRGEKGGDYAFLDRLMTALADQHPVIQAAATMPDPISPQLFLEEKAPAISADMGSAGLEIPAEKDDAQLQEPPAAEFFAPSEPEISVEPEDFPQAAFAENSVADEKMEFAEQKFEHAEDVAAEPQSFPVNAEAEQEALEMVAAVPNQEIEMPAPTLESAPATAETPAPDAAPQDLDAETAPPLQQEPVELNSAPAPMQQPEAPASITAAAPIPKPEPAAAPVETPSVPKKPSTIPPSVEPMPMRPATPRMEARPKEASTYVPESARRRRFTRSSYRAVAVLISILVIVAAGYFVLGTELPEPIQKAWDYILANSPVKASGLTLKHKPAGNESTAEGQEVKKTLDGNTVLILMDEARALAGEKRYSESKALLLRILDSNPSDEAAAEALKEIEEKERRANQDISAAQLKSRLLRIANLIDTGKLQPAKLELDTLQQLYPSMPELLQLRKKWEAKNAQDTQTSALREEEQRKAAQRLKDDEWTRQIGDLLARGKYNDAGNAVVNWQTETPGNSRALEVGLKVEDLQRNLKIYSAAMSENRYQDALSALNNMGRLNPGDSSISEMRRQIEAKRASARAMLTVRRLGAKGILLLDGRPIGKDGEIENESISIGNHTVAIENSGGLVASRNQEYLDGQRVTLVYDLAKLNLRPIIESDQELLAQRKAMEESHQFEIEHAHGAFRGNCSGMLTIDYLDVAYKPAAGEHGFRIPFKLLKISGGGKSVELYYLSDNKHFQSFKFQDERVAQRFRQIWGELKSIARTNP